MTGLLISQQMAHLLALMQPLLDFLETWEQRRTEPSSLDFVFGNPHDPPLSGFVAALQRQLEPHDANWFAYKMSEPETQAAIATGLRRWRGVDFQPDDVAVTNGAFAGLSVALRAVVDPGDEVVYLRPPWFFYEPIIRASQAAPVAVAVDEVSFDLDLAAIEAAISPRTRAIIVNSPHNPTGRIYPAETLTRLADILTAASAAHGRPIYLLSDEAYSRIIFDDAAYPSPTNFYPHTFLIYTYGKTLLTPGQRLGYIALPPSMPEPERATLRSALLLAQLVTGYAFPNALLQYALPDLEQLSIDVGQLQRRRDRLVDALQAMGYQVHAPQGTFYLFPRSPLADDLAFTNLLARQGILVLPGRLVEWPGYFRISLTATDDMIERALPGFASAIAEAQTQPAAGVSRD